MSDILRIILIATLITGAGLLTWWLLVASEGVYLGRRAVIWLYDVYANRYDGVKNYFPEYEQLYLANPLMDAIKPQTNPLVLDVATGTGRLPLALARYPEFDGHVVGVDLSRKMLHFASRNIYPHNHQITFLWCPAERLPFPDNIFDVVTCLEALEFMTQPEAVLKELIRTLRPGGILLVSQRINTRLMPGKTWDSGKMIELLEQNDVQDAHAQIWQVDYRKVWGRKKGNSEPIGTRSPQEVLVCPRCGKQGTMRAAETQWLCEHCKVIISVGADEVVELYRGYQEA